jgi:hypothetical protein
MQRHTVVLASLGLIVSLAATKGRASDWKGVFGVNLNGGTGLTGSPIKDNGIDPSVRSMTYGTGEFEFGMADVDDDGLAHGFGLAAVLRSVAFGPAAWDDYGGSLNPEHERPEWSGSGMGLRTSYTYGRFETSASLVLGNVRTQSADGTRHEERGRDAARSFLSPGVGFGLTLFRSRSFDLKLRAAFEPLVFDDRLAYTFADGSKATFNDHLNAQHVGLAMTFYPGLSSGGDTSGNVNFVGHCDYNCGQLMVEGGRVLVEVGSVLGRAMAEGLLGALLR